MADTARIVLVGHCTADSYMLKGVVERARPGAVVVRVNDVPGLERELPGADLLLVNRALDGDFDAPTGVELIRQLAPPAGAEGRPAMMLVSNYPDAQQAAEGAGATPGFGKSRAGSAEAAERIRAAVDAARARKSERAGASREGDE